MKRPYLSFFGFITLVSALVVLVLAFQPQPPTGFEALRNRILAAQQLRSDEMPEDLTKALEEAMFLAGERLPAQDPLCYNLVLHYWRLAVEAELPEDLLEAKWQVLRESPAWTKLDELAQKRIELLYQMSVDELDLEAGPQVLKAYEQLQSLKPQPGDQILAIQSIVVGDFLTEAEKQVFFEKLDSLVPTYLDAQGQFKPDWLWQSAVPEAALYAYILWARSLAELGDYEKALFLYSKVEKLAQAWGTKNMHLGVVYNTKANIYFQKQEYNKALACIELGLAQMNEADFFSLSQDWEKKSRLYRLQGKANMALTAARRAWDYAQAMPSKDEYRPKALAIASTNLAEAHLDLGQLDSAAHYLSLYPKNLNYLYGQMRQELIQASLWAAQGRLADSRKTYARVLGRYQNQGSDLVRIYLDWAKWEYKLKQYDMAEALAQKALIACSDSSAVEALSNQTIPTWDKIRFKQLGLQALKIRLSSYKAQQGDSLNLRPQWAEQSRLALEYLERLLPLLNDESSKNQALTDFYEIYEWRLNYLHSLWQQEPAEQLWIEAMYVAECSRAFSLRNQLSEAEGRHEQHLPLELYEERKQLQTDLLFYEEALGQARRLRDTAKIQRFEQVLGAKQQRFDSLVYRIKTEYSQFYQRLNSPDSLNLALYSQHLDDSSALMLFFEGQQQGHSLSMYQGRRQWTSWSVDEAYKTEIMGLSLRRQNQYQEQAAWALFQRILQAHWQPSIRRLITLPDGRLNLIPLELLCSRAPQDGQMPEWLLKQAALSQQYSLSLLEAQWEQPFKATNRQIFGIAPDYAIRSDETMQTPQDSIQQGLRQSLQVLPGAEAELNWLSKEFAGFFCQGQEANEAVFKQWAGQYGILHLAMHGLSNDRQPSESSLIFSHNPDNHEDDFLYPREIRELPLQAGLVVLSACETGTGQYQKGEGVQSLGRSFYYAGAPSLVYSLWVVNDHAGAQIMQHFYTALAEGEPKDKALQKAKLQYLEKYPEQANKPQLWAAFIQAGDYSAFSPEGRYQWIWWYLLPILAMVGLAYWSLRALRQRRRF